MVDGVGIFFAKDVLADHLADDELAVIRSCGYENLIFPQPGTGKLSHDSAQLKVARNLRIQP